jgi:hypothetical protein
MPGPYRAALRTVAVAVERVVKDWRMMFRLRWSTTA